MSRLVQLRVYRFDEGVNFDGGLISAIERLQLGGHGELLDALVVLRDAQTGEIDAVDMATGARGATVAALLDFRLDPRRRRAITERTLAEHTGGVPRAAIEATGDALVPGAAVLAVLHAGDPPDVLEEAVARSGGRAVAAEPVEAGSLAAVAERVTAAASA